MSTNYTPNRFSIQQPMNILLRDPSTLEIIAYLDDLKQSNLDNAATLVFPQGGRGNVYIGGGFTHSRRATLDIQKATWRTSVLAVQIGTSLVVGSNKTAVKYDVIEVASNKTHTSFTALGATGAEIGTVYLVNADGTLGAAIEQDAVAGAGTFSYTPATKLITFNTGDISDGMHVACAYNFDTGSSAQTITVNSDSMPSLALVTAEVLVKDLCSGLMYPGQIDGIAQIDPNWKWTLTANGEPAIQEMKLEFVKACSNKKLYDIIVFNEQDAL